MSRKENYNRTAKIYNARYQDTQCDKYRIMLSGLKLRGKIIDVGCGTGLLSEFLDRADIIGCDNSEEMLKIRGSGDLCDIENLPYKDTEFDFVFSFSVLMNCEHPEKAIKEIKRVLKPKGTFVCTFLKSFSSKITPLLEKHFKIQEEIACGEDVGFKLN